MAIETYSQFKNRGLRQNLSPFYANIGLAASYMSIGREKEARYHAEEVLKVTPQLNLKYLKNFFMYKNLDHLERFLSALQKAGIPENIAITLEETAKERIKLPMVKVKGILNLQCTKSNGVIKIREALLSAQTIQPKNSKIKLYVVT